MIDISEQCLSPSFPANEEGFVVKLPYILWKSPSETILYRLSGRDIKRVWSSNVPVISMTAAYSIPLFFVLSPDGVVYRYYHTNTTPDAIGIFELLPQWSPHIALVAVDDGLEIWYTRFGDVYRVTDKGESQEGEGKIVSDGLTVTRNNRAVVRWHSSETLTGKVAILGKMPIITLGGTETLDYAPRVPQWYQQHLYAPTPTVRHTVFSPVGSLGELEITNPPRPPYTYQARICIEPDKAALSVIITGELSAPLSVIGIYYRCPYPLYSFALPGVIRQAHIEKYLHMGYYFYHALSESNATKTIHVFNNTDGYLASYVLQQDGNIFRTRIDCLQKGNKLSEQMRRDGRLPEVTEENRLQVLAAALVNPDCSLARHYLQESRDFPHRLFLRWSTYDSRVV